MPSVRYVCLSDLHLGSAHSLLTDVVADEAPDVSAVMRALVICLRSLLAAQPGAAKPTLVLNGDVCELALASDEVSATVFARFMELVMAPGDEMFDEVWFVPGNHDHHLWEAAREAQYADYLDRHPPTEPIPHPWFTTRLLAQTEQHPVASPLLTALLRRARRAAGGVSRPLADEPAVWVAYPNLGLVSGDRCVVFHHGHYIEPAYRLLTNLNTALFGAPAPANVNVLEEGNFAWIDFFWSALGRAGEPGARVQYVYDRLRDPVEREELAELIASNLALVIGNRTPWAALEDEVQEQVMAFVFRQLGEWGSTLGRQAYYGGTTAVAAHDRGLEEYWERFVLEQLTRESQGHTPNAFTFVFGHTHHPLVRQMAAPGEVGRSLGVFNTGGWVHETKGLEPQAGASVVLVDEALDTVAVQLYRELPMLAERYPRVQSANGSPASGLHAHVSATIAADHEPWRDLAAAIALRLADSA